MLIRLPECRSCRRLDLNANNITSIELEVVNPHKQTEQWRVSLGYPPLSAGQVFWFDTRESAEAWADEVAKIVNEATMQKTEHPESGTKLNNAIQAALDVEERRAKAAYESGSSTSCGGGGGSWCEGTTSGSNGGPAFQETERSAQERSLPQGFKPSNRHDDAMRLQVVYDQGARSFADWQPTPEQHALAVSLYNEATNKLTSYSEWEQKPIGLRWLKAWQSVFAKQGETK